MPLPEAPLLCPQGTVVCLGSGPSLTREDVEYCRERADAVIAINDTHQLAPWATALYSSDQMWYAHYRGVPSFAGLKFGIKPLAPRPEWGITVLENTGDRGVEPAPTGLRTTMNSGGAAINLAVHFGATRIVLLGYDMAHTDGRTHFFGEHPNEIRYATHFDKYIALIRTMVQPLAQLGVTVINCSRRTALDAFPRMDLAEALP